jgi:DNA-binding transcriptional ArsR family regulator
VAIGHEESNLIKRLLVLALLLASTSGICAGEVEKQLVDRWYSALASVNRLEITALLDDKAKITLGDLDIEQSKSEFITSLDEWEDAMKGSTIRHTLESDADGILTVLVCYKFPENETLGREIFSFVDGKILTSNQETIAESCETFAQ